MKLLASVLCSVYHMICMLYDSLTLHRLVTLSEEHLLMTSRAMTLTSITTLNLHGNGLTKLKGLNTMPSLTKLIVSFNELTRLDDVAHLVSDRLLKHNMCI